jgi:adenine phosphoribosyltransferase
MDMIKSKIRTIPDFPKKGIMFRDITTLLKDAEGFGKTISLLTERYKNYKIDYIAGIEARGFILGGALACALGVGFIPLRKKGNLPGTTIAYDYDLEYGKDTIEIHDDALSAGSRILIVDDLLATGGTAMAAAKLIEKVGGVVEELVFVINLPDIGGSKKLEKEGYKAFWMCEFEGD